MKGPRLGLFISLLSGAILVAGIYGAWAMQVEPPPKYALLLFGPEGATQALLAVRENVADLHRGGSLIANPDRFDIASEKELTLADADGRTRYVITGISDYEEGDPPSRHLLISVRVEGAVSFEQYCDVPLKSDWKAADVAHFNGPLTIGPQTINFKLPEGISLEKGENPSDLRAVVGTFDASRHTWVVVRSHKGADAPAFPPGIAPTVEVEFPAAAEGEQPIKQTFPLDQFC